MIFSLHLSEHGHPQDCARCLEAARNREKCREMIVQAGVELVQMQLRAGALNDGWLPEQWRLEAEIIADQLLWEEE
jgi:hypothetical protein